MNTLRVALIFVLGWAAGFTSPHLFASLLERFPLERESSTFPIGALLCLTGECAEWGTEALNGMTLAAEELNARGGVLNRRVELVIEDSKDTHPADSVTAFKRLQNMSDLKYIVGPSWTPSGLAIAPLAARDRELIVTSPSLGVKDFDHAGDNLFNLWPHDEKKARLLARHAVERGWRRVAIFSSQQPWAKAQGDFFAEELESHGAEVTAIVEPLADARELKAEALRVAESSPDAVYFAVFSEQLVVAERELDRLGLEVPRLVILIDDTTLKLANGSLEGAISARFPGANSDFIYRYRARFGAHPGISADTAYDTVLLYAQAIERARTFEPGVVKKELAATTDFDGASGRVSFDEHGGVTKEPELFVIRGLMGEESEPLAGTTD